MTNTEILRRAELSWLHPDDLTEVLRIFEVVTDEKKVEILSRWDSIANNIRRHREQMEEEKKILLARAIDDIEHDLEEYNRSLVQKRTKKQMENLQQNI